MAEIRDYDITAANNNSSPPNGSPEGQLPSTINDTIREVMARLKREWSDRSGVNTTAGTSNAYTLAASQTITAYAAGDVFMFIADRANTGAATLAVDGLAAKSLVSNAQTALVANQIVANGIYVAAYDATNDTFQVMGVTDTGGALTLTSLSTDTINEKTAAAGVTVDGVLLKDGGAVFADGASVEVDTVNEATAATGVTVDGVLLKDGGAVFADGATIEVDTINEATAAAGVTADGVLLKDGGVSATAASSITASSGTALRVTNTGSGDSLLVEDSANPDSSPFVVDSAGAVGVGIASPDGKFHVHSGSAGTVTANAEADDLVVENSGNTGISILSPDANYSNFYLGSPTDGIGAYLRWRYSDLEAKLSTSVAGADLVLGSGNGAEAMRIDSNGDVTVGTPASGAVAYASGTIPSLQVNMAGPAQSGVSRWSNDSSANAMIFMKSRGGSIGTHTAVVDGDKLGVLGFYGSDGVSAGQRGALIQAEAEGTYTASSAPGALLFLTTSSGSTSPSERMRIDSSGNVGIGVTPSAKLHVTNTGAGDSLLIEDSANPDSTPFVIDAAGWVGLGTTDPKENVDIRGDVAVGAGAFIGNGLYYSADFKYTEDSTYAGYMKISNSLGDFQILSSDVTGTADASVTLLHRMKYSLADNAWLFYTAGTERMRIDSDGYVGIGTSPVRLLHLEQSDNPTIRLNETATTTSYAELINVNSTTSRLQHIAATGSPIVDLDSYASDDSSAQYVRIFRNSNSLAAGILALYQPGTSDIQNYFSSSDSFVVGQAGDFGVGTSSPTEKLDVNGDAIRVRTSQTPASASATGDAGQICWDANYIYVCTATNTWKRAALSTW